MCREKLAWICFFAFLHHKTLFFLAWEIFHQGVFNLGFYTFFPLVVLNQKIYFLFIFAYVRNSVTSSSPPHSLPFCSFSRQALLCHSCYLETWSVNTLAFISYTVFLFFPSFFLSLSRPPLPFTTVKTCGVKKIIYGCLCPFQSSSSPALPGECR